MTQQYTRRLVITLDEAGRHFVRHMMALTAEDLRSKSTIATELAWRDAEIARLRDALTFVRRGIESGHIEFSPIVLDQSGCFKQEHRRLTDVVNAALGDTNAHP